MNINYLDFEAWIAKQEDLPLDQIKVIDCEVCNGSGVEECDHCGHEYECDECDGTGKVTDFGDIAAMYDLQFKHDCVAFKRYMKALGIQQ